ncbi:MAG: GldG family protein [Candidatus Eisenbacteria bacterium]|jgi:ABC-type uncharacterized transport system involved in gliding motility auxiliary subunit|nr:GldG family protein [Candidatus Eisenbacteria bacterium]
MTRLQQLSMATGVAAVAAGLVLAAMGVGPESLSRIAIGAGILLLAAWPSSALRRVSGHARGATVPLALGCALILGLLVVLNLLASRHTLRWDTTRAKRFTLSPQTRHVLASLPGPVEAVAFSQDEDREARDLLAEYGAVSRHFTFRIVDPDRHPEEAQAFGIREYGTVVLSWGEQRERLTSLSEQTLTSALIRLRDPDRMSLHLVVGHGERTRADDTKTGISRLAETLAAENYAVSDVIILRDGLPEPGDLLMVPGPTSPFLAAEMDSLNRFLDRGGRIMVLLEPNGPSLREILVPRGILPRDDVIVDASGVGSIFGMSEVVPLVAQYDGSHPVTKGFTAASFFPMCRSLVVADSASASSTATCLAQTSDASWGETGSLSGDRIACDGDEDGGPLCVAAAASWSGVGPPDSTATPAAGRLVVFGDADFLSNGFIDVSGNRDLGMNAVSWLAERGELIAIRPRTVDGTYLTLTGEAARSIFILVVVVCPGAVVFAGLAVRLRRR